MPAKRLRVFAGPNGSGKSTLVKFVTSKFDLHFGYFVNADEIERQLKTTGFFDFDATGLRPRKQDFAQFAQASTFNEKSEAINWHESFQLKDNKLSLPGIQVNSYHAALVADFLVSVQNSNANIG